MRTFYVLVAALSIFSVAAAKTGVKPVFAAPATTFIYDSATSTDRDHDIYQLTRGAIGVPDRLDRNCDDSTPGLLKSSAKTGTLIWAVCIPRLVDFARILLTRKKILIIGESRDDKRNLVIQSVNPVTGKLLGAPRVLSTIGDPFFGSPIFAGVWRKRIAALYDPGFRPGIIRAFPANKLVNIPDRFGPFKQCVPLATPSRFLCLASIASTLEESLLLVDAATATIRKTAPLDLVSTRPENYLVNIFTHTPSLPARRETVWFSSTLAFSGQGSSDIPTALVVGRVRSRTMRVTSKKYIEISTDTGSNFGRFAVPSTFGKQFVIVAVNVDHDTSGRPFTIDGKFVLSPRKGTSKQLCILVLKARTLDLLQAFLVDSPEFTLLNSVPKVHTLVDGTVVVQSEFARTGKAKTASFVSLPQLLCRRPLPRSLCCKNIFTKSCKFFPLACRFRNRCTSG